MLKLLPLALRSLLRNRRRSAFTLLAIMIGVGVIIFVNGFGLGVMHMMVMQTVNSRVGAIQVHRRGYLKANDAAPLKLDMPQGGVFQEKLARVPGVKAVTGRIRFSASLSDGAQATLIMGQALDVAHEFEVCPERRDEVRELGTHLSLAHPDGAVLGGELARSFDGKVGSTFTLTGAGREGAINALDIQVVGINRGAAPLESKRMVSIPLPHAQDLLGMHGRVTEYVLALEDMDRLEEVATALRALLGDDYEVSTWPQVMPFLKDAVSRMGIILSGVNGVLFIIVLFGIINTMLMSVYERVREIGTMLAVGLRRRQILALFLLEAALLGMMGGTVGALVGHAITDHYRVHGILMSPMGATFKQIIRPEADPFVAGLTVLVALVGAVLAAAYPARKASLMTPMEALRTL